MSLRIFGKKAKVGKEIGNVMQLNYNHLCSEIPISQISHFFLNNPKNRKLKEATYTSFKSIYKLFEIENSHSIFLQYCFHRYFFGKSGKLGNMILSHVLSSIYRSHKYFPNSFFSHFSNRSNGNIQSKWWCL